MCGIAGILALDESRHLPFVFNMNDILQHRGGDDEGYTFFSKDEHQDYFGNRTPDNVKHVFPNAIHKSEYEPNQGFLALSHNRLSIVDVSHQGHQPMSNAQNDLWIVFNGEIYNFKELKTQLETLGYHFKSQTDTEVVLAAYQHWGKNCIKHFEGMWAFCIYDKKEQTLFLSRDRFGVKPLYFIKTQGYFAFASEQKALYHLPEFSQELNDTAVFDYLSMGLVEHQNDGFVKGIYELKPSENLTVNVSNGELLKEKYYQLNYTRKWESFDEKTAEKYIEKIADLVETSVKKRLQADVRVGSCLSGGIDSSVVVGFINKLLQNNKASSVGASQLTFTSCFKGHEVDEEKWAKCVTENTQTTWHKTHPNSHEFIDDFKDLAYYQDVPFFSSSTYAQYRVMKKINATGLKVTLDGQGADEVFAGYPVFYSSFVVDALANFDLKSIVNNATLNSDFSNLNSFLTQPLRFTLSKAIPNSLLFNLFEAQNSEFTFANPSFWKANRSNLNALKQQFNPNLNAFLHWYFTQEKLKNLMRTADRNAMRFSVESRMPFVDDHKLIEYVFSIPASYKIRNGKSKFLLREAAKNVLPTEIYNRTDKIGFGTPEKVWFKEQQHALLDFLPQENDDYINWKNLRSNWNSVFNQLNQKESTKLWRFINFAVWRNVHNI